MNHPLKNYGMDTYRFPVDPWKIIENSFSNSDYGKTETLFTVANGYIGMRANPEEGREAHTHGTFINGFHETWRIKHAEEAFGYAKIGQTIVNVPDAKLIKLYVDDEPFLLSHADLDEYERVLDFRSGVLSRNIEWRTPAGRRISIKSQRMVSFEHRHLAMMTYEVRTLDHKASIVISSQLLNRQDGEDEYYVPSAALGEGTDPRKASRFDHRVLEPRLQRHEKDDIILGYRCNNSKMTIACGYRHLVAAPSEYKIENMVNKDYAKSVIKVQLEKGQSLKIVKLVAYHTSTGVPAEELADRCQRTLECASADGSKKLFDGQKQWLAEFWENSDIEIDGDLQSQQAIRWNLFQLAQATGRAQENGIAAKGVTSSAYEGHYFWDTEIYLLPFLAYTNPEMARKLLRFRWQMLPSARERAKELNQKGALYPWRTINGQEASAYYAAGTAQYHINAAIAYALKKYYNATGDFDFLSKEGAHILIETARLWEDLGFFSEEQGKTSFHIHRVTGPDEYTTVVNDNFYTNVMARFNLDYAMKTIQSIKEKKPEIYEALCRETGLSSEELEKWRKASELMYLPYDEKRKIHPQDANFLDLEPWNFKDTPQEKFPLLLHYHPLVIYRHQVLKQADVVLALFLHGEMFSIEEKRRDFDFYDPITTGDSSLSVCVQSIVAAQIGYKELAAQYFQRALYLDLMDLHGNTADGVHVASAAGVWAVIVYGFAGFVDKGESIYFIPKLPLDWKSVSFKLKRNKSLLQVNLEKNRCTVLVLKGTDVCFEKEGKSVFLNSGENIVYQET